MMFWSLDLFDSHSGCRYLHRLRRLIRRNYSCFLRLRHKLTKLIISLDIFDIFFTGRGSCCPFWIWTDANVSNSTHSPLFGKGQIFEISRLIILLSVFSVTALVNLSFPWWTATILPRGHWAGGWFLVLWVRTKGLPHRMLRVKIYTTLLYSSTSL